MSLDVGRPDLTVGVVGAGAMGRGIAQVAATGGMRVVLYDARADAAAEARRFVGGMLDRAAEKGTLGRAEADAAIARIGVAPDYAAFASCDLVVEAVVEDLAVKRAVFDALEAVVSDTCILATNTSSLSVTRIAAGCRLPGRFAGFHFFNPVPLMRLVEVVAGVQTDGWVVDALLALGRRMGREPVRVADVPGFLVNQVGRGLPIEAAHLVAETGIAFADVDRVMREAAGFRMGPFELLDLTALDVSHPATEAMHEQFYGEPRYRPSPLMRSRLHAGLLGRKAGRGFYTYGEGAAPPPPEPTAPEARPAAVWISRSEPAGHAAALALLRTLGATIDDGPRPATGSLCVVTPLGADASDAALADCLEPERTVALDTLLPLDRRRTLMANPLTTPEMLAAAHGLLAADGVPVTVIPDSPGFIAQRILAMIVNIGCAVAQQRAATPADIDTAVTLGLAYPKGPLAWGDALGPRRVLSVLQAMQRLTGDPRYRPTLWLSRRARLGVSLLTPDRPA